MFGLDVLHERVLVDRGVAAVLAVMPDTQMLRPDMSPDPSTNRYDYKNIACYQTPSFG